MKKTMQSWNSTLRPGKGLNRGGGLKRGTSSLKRSPMSRKPSAKQVEKQAAWSRITQEKLDAGMGCELAVQSICDGRPCCGHHVKKRRCGDYSRENHRLSCIPCNNWVEEHPDEARALKIAKKSWE